MGQKQSRVAHSPKHEQWMLYDDEKELKRTRKEGRVEGVKNILGVGYLAGLGYGGYRAYKHFKTPKLVPKKLVQKRKKATRRRALRNSRSPRRLRR